MMTMTRELNGRGEAFLEGLQQVVVAGFGRSGQAAAAWLAARGVPLTIIDARPRAAHARALASLPATTGFVPQEEAASLLATADLVILSPGIDPRQSPYVEARRSGVPLISELELGWRFVESPLVAVTGSNGKSTVTSLIGALLEASGFDTRVCGNIGTPLTASLDTQDTGTRFVVEVSSFQLEGVTSFAPDVAVLLNVTPDHQDRYPDHDAYIAAKERLFAWQPEHAYALLSADDPAARQVARRLRRRQTAPRLLLFGDDLGETEDRATVEKDMLAVTLAGRTHRLLPVSDLPLPGPHNRSNCLAALAAALCAGAAAAALAGAMHRFRPLPHRLETVGARNGVTFVNDSKATNLESARMALHSFPPHSVFLIMGGRDKGSDFAALAPDLIQQARQVYVIGEAKERIMAALTGPLAGQVPLTPLADLPQALAAAAKAAGAGDTVLLAPSCASFDAYRDFGARGDHFRQLASAWIREGDHGA